MGFGTGAFDIKDRVAAKVGSPIQREAARQGNYNYGYHGQKLGYKLDYLQKAAGSAQVVNDYRRAIVKKGPSGLIPSGEIISNIQTRNGDNDIADQNAMRDGFRQARSEDQ